MKYHELVKDPQIYLLQSEMFFLSSRNEGFPNAMLGAMACGLSAICIDCPSGPREIIRNGFNGILTPPEDVDALATVLDRLISDDAERGTNTLEVKERFATGRIVFMWDGIIGNVTNQVESCS